MSNTAQEPVTKKVKVEEGGQDKVESSTALAQKNDQGESFFDLSKMRRLTVRQFKGATLIDIREFYGDETLKPGKKGISLSLKQFETLKTLIQTGAIDEEIEKLEDK